jgi:hypothetical protein
LRGCGKILRSGKSEKGGRVAKKPGAQQVKKEKRDLHIEPAPAGMSRRRF